MSKKIRQHLTQVTNTLSKHQLKDILQCARLCYMTAVLRDPFPRQQSPLQTLWNNSAENLRLNKKHLIEIINQETLFYQIK
jgi:hypothetical protein